MRFITNGNFILGAPFETEEHIEKTVDFACSLPLDLAFFYPLGYMYGSDLYNEAVQNGIIPKDGDYYLGPDARKKMGNYSYEQLSKYCKYATNKFYLRPSYITDQLIMAIKRLNFRLIRMQLNYLF
jgi:magnesium-protoporphyrin IX monomethyl ester (oxidative) cyclase